jgi:hypothetical protein
VSKGDSDDLGGLGDLNALNPLESDLLAPLDSHAGAPAESPPAAPPAALATETADDSKKKKKERKKDRNERKERAPRGGDGEPLVQRLKTASPYTVMLAVSLAVIIAANLCLIWEWYQYGFSISAQ